MDLIAPPARPLRLAFLEHLRVVHALMLRDIKTRFGASYFGFLIGLLLPLGHIGVILTVYILLGRRAAIGTDVSSYLATAILPFIIWSYTHQKVMQSFIANRPLTAFPIVKYRDILTARALVELLNATLIVIVVATALGLSGSDIFIDDPPRFLFALILAYFFGVSTGFIFGLLAILTPAVMLVGFVFIPLNWVTAGVFFIPDALPAQVRNAVAVFPLSHIVDFGRSAFFSSYLTDFPQIWYVLLMIAANFVVAFSVDYFLRPALTAK